MRFRKLRIAWSVGWGLLTVLLCVLWLRSYQATDLFPRPFCISTHGRFVIWLREDKRAAYSANQMIFSSSETLQRMSRIDIDTEPFEIEPFSSRSGFYIEHDYRRTVVQLPYCFLTILFVSIANLPWFHWRFSIRTLLIATTLVAVVLGVIVAVLRWPAG